MKQIEIIKKDGIIEVNEKETNDNKKYNLEGDEKILENIINYDNIDKDDDYIFIKNISILFNILKTREDYYNILSTSFNKIKKISSEQDIKELITYLNSKYENSLFNKKSRDDNSSVNKRYIIRDVLNKNKDIVYLNIIKKTIDGYFNKTTNKLDLDSLELLLNLIREDKIDEVVDLLDLSFEDFNDNDLKNHCYKMLVNSIISNKQAKEKHLCSLSCANLSPLTCPKVNDIYKRNIEDYDFIKSGYQVFHEDDNGRYILDSFVVTDCDYYYKAKEKKKVLK